MYSNGKSELGRFLSNFTLSKFVHPTYGEFYSIEGFWFWLSTGLKFDELRTMYGLEARNHGRSLERVPFQNFEEEIKKAIRIKIESNTKMRMLLILNTLPLTHYYVFKKDNTVNVHVVHQLHWQVKFIEDLAAEYRKDPKKVKIVLGEKPHEVNKSVKPQALLSDFQAKREITEIEQVL